MLMFTEDAASSKVYLNILQNDFIPFLLDYIAMDADWFQ
jgi:hypothetical protein